MIEALPLQALERSYERLLALCDELKALAVSLPDRVDPAHCLRLADEVEPLMALTHQQEEAELFPLLENRGRPELQPIAQRLREEHLSDSSAAEEVGDALRGLISSHTSLSADAVGYLLRVFFQSLRRHVQSERELLAVLRPRAGMNRLH